MKFDVAVFDLVRFLFLFLVFILHRAEQDLRHHRRLAVDIPDFISIACGAPEDFLDDRYGIPYKSDNNLIDSGVSYQISQETDGIGNRFPGRYTNLRSFPEGVRNCYTFKLSRNEKYLIRAVFVYGNYDGKNSVPMFTIYLGVEILRTVQVTYQLVEVIHVVSTDFVDVCLVNIGTGVPYISALELRRLNNATYPIHTDKLLEVLDRSDAGGNRAFRYPQDVYDRIWLPRAGSAMFGPDTKDIWTNQSIIPARNDNPYKLPELMLQTASAAKNSSSPLIFGGSMPGSQTYFCFHFVEIEKLPSGKFREMSIIFNEANIIANSTKLEYLKPQTICSSGLSSFLDRPNFVRISAPSNSDLPPILNGIEVFVLKDLVYLPTFIKDVNAIMSIKQKYKLKRNWQGDPCLPTSYIWEGLSCSRSNPPRIISLNLSRSQLIGDLLSDLSGLTQLEALDLSYNGLTGSLPEFLAQLPHLKIINLDGNNLEGTVPEALLLKLRNGTLKLSMNENPKFCLSPPCKKRRTFGISILIVVATTVVLLILLGILAISIKRIKRNSRKLSEEGLSLKQKSKEYTFSEVVSITNNFKTIIGEGGFGKVYLGTLPDQTLVAVKLLSPSSKQGYKEFHSEAQLLMIVHHRNLVSLIGYCDDVNTKALIYEYMANGNLQQHLSDRKEKVLRWNKRVQIALDAAHGLDYLHNGCRPPIIHRDLKPTNILLNDEMQAKIADFGLSKTFMTGNESQYSRRLVGTIGYLDPDNRASGKISKKSDVYSFGIILFELISGVPAIGRSSNGDPVHILSWVTPLINGGDIHGVVDGRLQAEFSTNSAWKMVEIAMSCTQPVSNQRPDISQVLEELKGCVATDEAPPQPKSFTETFSTILPDSDMVPSLR